VGQSGPAERNGARLGGVAPPAPSIRFAIFSYNRKLRYHQAALAMEAAGPPRGHIGPCASQLAARSRRTGLVVDDRTQLLHQGWADQPRTPRRGCRDIPSGPTARCPRGRPRVLPGVVGPVRCQVSDRPFRRFPNTLPRIVCAASSSTSDNAAHGPHQDPGHLAPVAPSTSTGGQPKPLCPNGAARRDTTIPAKFAGPAERSGRPGCLWRVSMCNPIGRHRARRAPAWSPA
jgi:hypothetical protein